MSDQRKTIELLINGHWQGGTAIGAARSAVKNFADGTVGEVQRAMGAIANVQNLIIAGAGTMAAKAVFEPSIQMETFRTQFAVLLGSTDAAAKRLAELDKFAAATPFELPGIAQASRVLQVMTEGALATGSGLRLVGDVAAGTGQPIEELAVWFGRLYSGLQAGAVPGDVLARFTELGILSATTRKQLEQMAKTGSTGAQMWDVFSAATGRFNGQMDQLSATTAGRISTLSDTWRALRRQIGDEALPALSQAVADLITDLEKLQATGELRKWGQDVARGIRTLYTSLKDLAAFISANKDSLMALGITAAGIQTIRAATSAIAALRAGLTAATAATAAQGVASTITVASTGAIAPAAATAAVGIGAMTVAMSAFIAGGAGLAGIIWSITELNKATAELAANIDATNNVNQSISTSKDRGDGTRAGMADRKVIASLQHRAQAKGADTGLAQPAQPATPEAPIASPGAGRDEEAIRKAEDAAKRKAEQVYDAQQRLTAALKDQAEMELDIEREAGKQRLRDAEDAASKKEDMRRAEAEERDRLAQLLGRDGKTPDQKAAEAQQKAFDRADMTPKELAADDAKEAAKEKAQKAKDRKLADLRKRKARGGTLSKGGKALLAAADAADLAARAANDKAQLEHGLQEQAKATAQQLADQQKAADLADRDAQIAVRRADLGGRVAELQRDLGNLGGGPASAIAGSAPTGAAAAAMGTAPIVPGATDPGSGADKFTDLLSQIAANTKDTIAAIKGVNTGAA